MVVSIAVVSFMFFTMPVRMVVRQETKSVAECQAVNAKIENAYMVADASSPEKTFTVKSFCIEK